MNYFEELALELFRTRFGVEKLIRENMKQTAVALFSELDNSIDSNTCCIETLEELRRTPDAIAVFTADQAGMAGLPYKKPAIVFCEAEHTSPLTPNALIEYSNLFDEVMDGHKYQVAVAVIERYGRTQFLNLSAIYHATIILELKKRGLTPYSG